MFWCISWPPESSPSKIIFSRLGWLKRVFMHFLTTRIMSFKIFFLTAGMVKNVFFMHFHTTRFKSIKNYFLTSGVVTNVFWCIDRPPESSPLFFTSGVVQNVFLCICAYFQTTRIKSLKNYFFHLWSGQKRVFMHFLITRIKVL